MALNSPVSDEILREIGRVVVNFQLLESQFAMYVWTLLGVNQRLVRS